MTDRDEPLADHPDGASRTAEAPSESPSGAPAKAAATRRRVLIGAGALGAAGILAACGDDSTPQPPVTTGAPPTPPPTAPPTTQPQEPEPPASEPAAAGDLTTAEVPVGSGVIVRDKNAVVTQPTPGDFRAFSSTCTHMQCQVTEVSGATINCPCHGSQFSIEDGSVKRGPARQPLPVRGVTVSGDSLTIG